MKRIKRFDSRFLFPWRFPKIAKCKFCIQSCRIIGYVYRLNILKIAYCRPQLTGVLWICSNISNDGNS